MRLKNTQAMRWRSAGNGMVLTLEVLTSWGAAGAARSNSETNLSAF
jgi:hypothetical protein